MPLVNEIGPIARAFGNILAAEPVNHWALTVIPMLAPMQARHQLGAEHYTIGGYYTGHMVRTPQGWRIARYRLTVTFSDGDRRLMGIAYRKATSARVDRVPSSRASAEARQPASASIWCGYGRPAEHAAHQDSETKSQEFEGSREVNPRAILRVVRGTCMLQHTIKAVIRPGEQSGYVAECLEIPVVTQGRTLDEVTRNLQEAVALHLDGEDLAALGLAASPTVVVTMELQPTNA